MIVFNKDPDFLYLMVTCMKDAVDLLQGHFKVSVGGDITPPSQTGGLEAIAVRLKRHLSFKI